MTAATRAAPKTNGSHRKDRRAGGPACPARESKPCVDPPVRSMCHSPCRRRVETPGDENEADVCRRIGKEARHRQDLADPMTRAAQNGQLAFLRGGAAVR